MEYNLAQNSNCASNTDIGNVDILVSEMRNLVSSTTNTDITLSGTNDDILAIDCDLGYRVIVDEIRYYFTSTWPAATVASGIEFSYKNESFENYSPLGTNVGAGYYYTTVSGVSSPRYVRLVHTVSGTLISGTVAGYEIINDDEQVDFGTDGTITSRYIATTFDEGEEIWTIPVYNSGYPYQANAYAALERQGTDLDSMIALSASASGPWITYGQTNEQIGGPDTWSVGTFDNTEVDPYDRLILSNPTVTGTYITRFFGKSSQEALVNLDLDAEYGTTDAIVAVDAADTTETIEIKRSNIKPMDDSAVRYADDLTDSESTAGYHKIRLHDAYRQDINIERYKSEYVYQVATYNYSFMRMAAAVDNATENSAIYYSWYRNTGNGGSLFTMDRDMADVKTLNLSLGFNGFSQGRHPYVKMLEMDYERGVWGYFYASGDPPGTTFDQGAGYYFIHWDSDLNETMKLWNEGHVLMDFAPIPNTTQCWYTDLANNQIVKLEGSDGSVITNIANFSTVKGVDVIPSTGGCWFIAHDGLVYKADSDGNLLTELGQLEEVNLSRIRVATNDEDTLWLLDGSLVKQLNLNSLRYERSTQVEYAELLTPVNDGVWVSRTDGKYQFVGKSSGQIEVTWESPHIYNIPAFLDHTYDDIRTLEFAAEFPTVIDTHWETVEWEKIIPAALDLPEELYYQARITLRPDGSTSPLVNGLYLTEWVNLPDIAPDSYKNVYLKTHITDYELTGDYDTKLKVRWGLPV